MEVTRAVFVYSVQLAKRKAGTARSTHRRVHATPKLPHQSANPFFTASRHGLEAAEKAQADAASLVGGDADAAAAVPEASLTKVNFPAKAFYLLSAVGICASSSDARRQIKGGAVRLEGEKIIDPNHEFSDASALDGKVLQVGKKIFRRLMA